MSALLSVEDVIELHDIVAPGAPLINRGALAGAVARPQASFDGKFRYPSIYSQASVLMHGICQAHAFLDGNKRTAWTASITLLELNGVTIRLLDDETMSDYMVMVAEHVVGEDDTAYWLAALDLRNHREL